MSFLLGTSNRNRYNTRVNENTISIEENGYLDFMMESYEESSKLTQALYVADLMLENKHLQGEDVEMLIESTSSGFIERCKQFINKLWEKIKAWFKKVKEFFQVLFTHGKDFVKKFDKQIRDAAGRVNGFKYSFYDISDTNLKALLSFDLAEDTADILEIIDTFSKYAIDKPEYSGDSKKAEDITNYDDDEKAALTSSDSASSIAKEQVKEMVSQKFPFDFDNVSEFKKEFKEYILGGEDREEFEDFTSGPDYIDMINILKDSKDVIRTIEKGENKVNKALKNAIKKFDSLNKDATKDDVNATKAANIIKEGAQAMTNYMLAAYDVSKECIKILAKDSENVLKSLLRHRPKKESTSYYQKNNSEDLLETALRII